METLCAQLPMFSETKEAVPRFFQRRAPQIPAAEPQKVFISLQFFKLSLSFYKLSLSLAKSSLSLYKLSLNLQN